MSKWPKLTKRKKKKLALITGKKGRPPDCQWLQHLFSSGSERKRGRKGGRAKAYLAPQRKGKEGNGSPLRGKGITCIFLGKKERLSSTLY